MICATPAPLTGQYSCHPSLCHGHPDSLVGPASCPHCVRSLGRGAGCGQTLFFENCLPLKLWLGGSKRQSPALSSWPQNLHFSKIPGDG